MKNLVLLTDLIPDLAIDLIYATPHNFTKQPVYPPGADAYLCKGPAERLKKAQENLRKRRLRLKVWDAYRPLHVQKIFWELVPDPRYVGNPAIGSKHNRGAAVDVTLVDEFGEELSMPSAFDDFTERAHRQNSLGHPNLAILTEAMEGAGFLSYESEWWHYEDPDWNQYPILDLCVTS